MLTVDLMNKLPDKVTYSSSDFLTYFPMLFFPFVYQAKLEMKILIKILMK